MCEWCTKHGAGKKWYMDAKYYSAEVAKELDMNEYLMEQLKNFQEAFLRYNAKLERRLRMPLIGRLIRTILERQVRNEKPIWDAYRNVGFYGQTVPLEDGKVILEKVVESESIIYDNCYCRWMHRGIKKRCCFEFVAKSEIVDKLPKYAPKKPRIDLDEAKEELEKHNREGFAATIYFVPAPRIASLCSCERPECYPYRVRTDYGLKTAVYKAEYVAVVDPDTCQGCKSCVSMCQFGAIRYIPLLQRVMIDPEKCIGCGVCRHACEYQALTLISREAHPLVADNSEAVP